MAEYDQAKLLEAVGAMLDQKLESKLTERKLAEREYFHEMKSEVIKMWQDQTHEFYKHIRSDDGVSSVHSKEEPQKASSNMSMHTESLRNPSPKPNIREGPKKVNRIGAEKATSVEPPSLPQEIPVAPPNITKINIDTHE